MIVGKPSKGRHKLDPNKDELVLCISRRDDIYEFTGHPNSSGSTLIEQDVFEVYYLLTGGMYLRIVHIVRLLRWYLSYWLSLV